MDKKRTSYLTAAPLMNRNVKRAGRDTLIAQLKSIGVSRVFLPLSSESVCGKTHDEELDALRENCAVLKEHGFEVGAWFWAFQLPGADGVTYMESPSGKKSGLTVCPMDAILRRELGRFVQEVAACGVDLIMFDDDLRYGFQDMGFGCTCPLHRRRIGEILGEPTEKDELKRSLFSGGPNPVRSAFVQANGEALELFCMDMRRSLDSVRPQVRMGFCSCITSWNSDGAPPDALSGLLAGKTRPFYRLIGAPYWGAMRAWGNRLGDVIELERAEAARRHDPGIEVFSEGDTFPRPRFATPASYVECFDTALRAAACTDGILKYAQDYTANSDYETGYIEAAVRNMEIYSKIDGLFADKKTVGIRVYDKPDRYETGVIPEDCEIEDVIQNQTFPATGRFAVANSLPTVYEGGGVCGMAFGDDADAVPDSALSGGLVLDVRAAKKLCARGVDVGIAKAGELFTVSSEHFLANNNYVSVSGGAKAAVLTLNDGAEILSVSQDEKALPLSYRYQNADGARFLVYAYEGYWYGQGWFRVYDRARQVSEFAGWNGSPLPVFCPGHPELYLIARSDGKKLAVGLWNLFADPVCSALLTTDPSVVDMRCVRGEASVQDGRVLVKMIPAFDFMLLELTLKTEESEFCENNT